MKLAGTVTKKEKVELELTPLQVAQELKKAQQAYLFKGLSPLIDDNRTKGMGAPDDFLVYCQAGEVYIWAEWGRHPRNYEIRQKLELTDSDQLNIVRDLLSMEGVISFCVKITGNQKTPIPL